jgi:hypothetical protein
MGLKVNYAKSSMMHVNVSDQKIAMLAAIFRCAVGQLPFTYLGLPLGTTRPTICDLSPLVGLIERRLNTSSRFLGYGGRLEYVKSVLSSLPTFFLCTLKVQKTILDICDRARRHCLWDKKEDASLVNSLAAWNLVCRPKSMVV